MKTNLLSIVFAVVMSVVFQGCSKPKQALVPDPGVVSYSFRNDFSNDVPGTLDRIRELGITHIEFSNLFGQSAEALRGMLDARGLICRSYGVSYDAVVNETDRVATEAETLGARFVRVAWIPHEPRGEFTLAHAQRAVEDFNRAGKRLREQGLRLCYHNHGYEFRPHGDGTLFDYIVQHTDPDAVGFEMDTLWVQHPGADPVKLLQTYPDRFFLMHLKDLRKGVKGDFSGGTPKENDVVLGTGQIDIPAVLRAAQETRIEYYFIEDESANPWERVPQSRAYIQSILADG